MDLKLKGKRALVLGASMGLGRSIAQMLASEGARVAICSRNKDQLEKTAREIKAEVALPSDLTKPQAAINLVDDVKQKLGGIDILVTNSGGPPKGIFSEIKTEDWLSGFQGLWISAVEAIQAVLPEMKDRRWGRILLVTSVAAKEPMPSLTVSNGLRAGLLGLSKSLSHEVARYGVTVNALLPGYTRTERLRELGVSEEKMTAHIPAGRLGEPEELAALATFLASEQAAYVTGQMIACDGGYLRGL
ncbi:MAG: SDR family oxidoreductase [Bdellovibrionota bacterium]